MRRSPQRSIAAGSGRTVSTLGSTAGGARAGMRRGHSAQERRPLNAAREAGPGLDSIPRFDAPLQLQQPFQRVTVDGEPYGPRSGEVRGDSGTPSPACSQDPLSDPRNRAPLPPRPARCSCSPSSRVGPVHARPARRSTAPPPAPRPTAPTARPQRRRSERPPLAASQGDDVASAGRRQRRTAGAPQ